MKINFLNSPIFQKKLVATATIGEKCSRELVNIYQYDKPKDYKDIAKQFNSYIWKGNKYGKYILRDIKRQRDKLTCLVMESKSGEIINCASVTNDGPDELELSYIETAPAYKCINSGDESRKFRFAGETMMACIVEIAKKNKQKAINVHYEDASVARLFYENKCNFKIKSLITATLHESNYEKMINNNAQHIGGSLNMEI